MIEIIKAAHIKTYIRQDKNWLEGKLADRRITDFQAWLGSLNDAPENIKKEIEDIAGKFNTKELLSRLRGIVSSLGRELEAIQAEIDQATIEVSKEARKWLKEEKEGEGSGKPMGKDE
jgi:chromosome segregation ATPase